jgi:hypothetical protein
MTMNSPNKEDNGTAAATTKEESAVLAVANSPSASTTIMSSLPRGRADDRNDNSAAAATVAIGQDFHGDDGEPPHTTMNPPNEEMANDEAAVNNTNTTRAVASNNGGSASGATIEAAPPPSAVARAITMASTLLVMSRRSLGLADGENVDDSYGSNLADDGEKSPPSKGINEAKTDLNSARVVVGQELNLMHAANDGSNLEVVENEDCHPITPATKDQYKPPLSLFAEASVRNLKQQKKEDVKVEKDGTKEVEKDYTAMLKGTPTYSNQDGIWSHVIDGVWKFKREKGPFNQSFGLCCVLSPHEDKNILPKSGLYNGSFAYEYQDGVSNHKISGIVEEHNVKISFLEDKGVTNKLSIKGNGINQFGTFKLKGTSTKKSDNPPLYVLHLKKKQIAAPFISQVQVSSSSAAATIMATTPSNNEATAPGVTVEAPNSSTATATIMSDSSLAVALSSLPLGYTNDMYNNKTAADVGMDAEPAINNKAAAYPKRGAFFQIEIVREAAADLKEKEEENTKDNTKRYSKNVRKGSKSAALHHHRSSRDNQRAQKQDGEAIKI